MKPHDAFVDMSARYSLTIVILKPNKTKEEQNWNVDSDFKNVSSIYYNGDDKKLEQNKLLVWKPRNFF